MLPAVAQGAIGVERRADDARADHACGHPRRTHGSNVLRPSAPFLRIDGSCETPIAGLAILNGAELWLRGEILRPDGSQVIAGDIRGPIADGPALGQALAERLLAQAGPNFFG